MFDILHRVGINAKPEKVFAALTTIEGLRGWWISIAAGSTKEGEIIETGAFNMRVVKCTASTLVEWKCIEGPAEWVDTEITFHLVSRDNQTYVMFKQTNWKKQTEFMHHSSTKWATLLLSLRDLIELGKGRAVPNDQKIFVGEGHATPLPIEGAAA